MTDQILLKSDIVEIVKGDDVQFDVYLYDKDGRPYDLTGFDEFKLCIKIDSSTVLEISEVANANGSILTKNSPDELGHLTALIKSTDTATLKASDRLQDFDIKLNNSGSPNPRTVKFENLLLISEQICS